MKKVLLEICCGSAEDAVEAWKAGADRAELCSNLFHGGLTPTLGSLRVVKNETDIKAVTMVRPREGGFCYTDVEFKVAIEDAKLLASNGSDGLVFGFLHPDGRIDMERSRIIADIAHEKGIESVFHRAIDVVPDWKEALDMLMELKITRVLTSGLEYDVSIATDTVREMIDYAAGRIQVMPGAGITARNMERVIRETGAEQIHLACHKLMFDHSTANNRAIYYGGCLYPPEDQFKITDRDTVAGMVQKLG